MPKLIQKSLKTYLNLLSSDAPAPGGGSASAAVGAMGTSLILMVSRIIRKKLDKNERKTIDKQISGLTRVLKDLEEIIDLDVSVYQKLIKAYRSTKQNSKENALTDSFRLQADLAMLILIARGSVDEVARFAKGSIANDLLVAKGFLDGAFNGAIATARINVAYMKSSKVDHYKNALQELEKKYKSKEKS